MDEALQARTAAREAIADISPSRLRDAMDGYLTRTSMIPGVLTVVSARVMVGDGDDETVLYRAAGVQLIYDGLKLTRRMVHEEPWADGHGELEDDLDVLAADVLVSRGFQLLSHTEAADKAVETVREFGREQTDIQTQEGTSARSLETNVFELAAIAGATAGGKETPIGLRQYVMGLARSAGEPPLPTAVEGLPESIEEVMHRVGQQPAGDDRIKTHSASDR